MKRTVIDCDKCGKETPSALQLAIPNGTHRYNDGVENNIDFLYEHKDLCPECAAKLFSFMFTHGKQHHPGGDPTLTPIGKHRHPKPDENDAIRLALKYLGIKEK